MSIAQWKFYGVCEHVYENEFSFVFMNLDEVLKNPTPGIWPLYSDKLSKANLLP